jgi:hypothetical protein
MQFQMQKLVAEVIEFVCLSILRICVYLIFFIQKIWAYILIILGPIAVGMALVPDLKTPCTAGYPNSSILISTHLLPIHHQHWSAAYRFRLYHGNRTV